MKTFLFKSGLLFLCSLQILTCSAEFKDEILKLKRIDLLPRFQDDITVKQISSYDTTGGNDDGFSGKYSYLRKENGTLVIADLKGPGVIRRIWTPTPTRDTIRFYFDGETKPRISLPFIDLFSGKNYPFVRPVVGNEVGGYYCYIPVPYKSSCKIIYKGERMQFIQIQYTEMNKSAASSFPEKLSKEEDEALTSVIEAWKNTGNINPVIFSEYQSEVKSSVKNVVLKQGENKLVFETNKGGRIVGIEITPQLQLNSLFKDLIIRSKWDDEKVASIICPVADFFGYAFGKPSMQSMLVGVNKGKHYCYLPMPFDKKAKIELEFLQSPLNITSEIPVKVEVFYTDTKRNQDEGKFYSLWKREINPELGKPYQFLEKSGRGHYVGTSLQAQGLDSGMTIFFEGDDECYIDGELRLHGTGSEDYFNGGWYALADRWDQAFSLPLHGCLAYSIPLAHTGGYRFFLTDKISFEKNISISIEHGPENNKIPVDYTSVAYYYCDTPPESNELPPAHLLEKINSPKMMEYWIQLLPVKALGDGTLISNDNCKDEKTGKNYDVLKIETKNSGFAKFELEVPSEGEYKLYLSYFNGPECGLFDINQRQVPVKINMNGFSEKYTFIEKELIGTIFIKDGTNTITIALKNNSAKPQLNNFLLQRIFLEKL